MNVDVPSTAAGKFLDGGSLFQPELLEFALLTAIIEVPLFYWCGWRRLGDCAYFAGVNVVTNLLLNEFLSTTDAAHYLQIILPCEIFVVLLEFALCSYRFGGGAKLFKVLVFTNATSFLIGLILEFGEVF